MKMFLKNFNKLLGVGHFLLFAGLIIEFFAFQILKYYRIPIEISGGFQIVTTIILLVLLISGLIWFNLTLKLIEINFKGKKKELVVKGPFAFVRHPLYSFISLALPPLFIIWNQDLIFLFSWLLIIIIVHLIVKFEEKGLIREFGNNYLLYRKRVPAIIPWKGKYIIH